MKRWACLVVLLGLAVPGWAAKKMTVAELKAYLSSAHQAGKSDAEVSAELQNIELTDQLTHSTMNSLAPAVPGQLTTEQLYILEVRSAVLPPPADDLPKDPAPDATAQKAILDKAADYAAKTYGQLPSLKATKTVRRFQDTATPGQQSYGAHSSAAVGGSVSPIRYAASSQNEVLLHNGVEQNPMANDKTKWGDNGMLALMAPEPSLTTVMQEAQAAGKLTWLRWDSLNGHKVAVFSFSVDKKKSHTALDYCCFPETSQQGPMSLRGTAAGGESGNYQTGADWKHWKSTVGYHGEIFVQPDTGVIDRLITEADLKSGDPVKAENRRVDYGEQKVGDKTVMVPVRTLTDTLAQPFPDLPQGRFILRHTLFLAEYSNYAAE